MRLIDADAINWDRAEDYNGNPVYVLDKRDIDNEPTAYDIDKVVKELRDYQDALLTDRCCLSAYNVGKAIEIVKRGGEDDIRRNITSIYYGEYQPYASESVDNKIVNALEKQIPQLVANDGMRIPFSYYCPTCNEELSDDGYKDKDIRYCPNCGQAIKWE